MQHNNYLPCNNMYIAHNESISKKTRALQGVGCSQKRGNFFSSQQLHNHFIPKFITQEVLHL